MNVDQTINEWLAPVADWFGAVMFYSVPVAGAQLPLILVWLIMGGIVCTLAFRFVNLRGFRHSTQVIRGDYSSKSPSRRGLALPGAEHRRVRHGGSGRHRRCRGGRRSSADPVRPSG